METNSQTTAAIDQQSASPEEQQRKPILPKSIDDILRIEWLTGAEKWFCWLRVRCYPKGTPVKPVQLTSSQLNALYPAAEQFLFAQRGIPRFSNPPKLAIALRDLAAQFPDLPAASPDGMAIFFAGFGFRSVFDSQTLGEKLIIEENGDVGGVMFLLVRHGPQDIEMRHIERNAPGAIAFVDDLVKRGLPEEAVSVALRLILPAMARRTPYPQPVVDLMLDRMTAAVSLGLSKEALRAIAEATLVGTTQAAPEALPANLIAPDGP